MVHATIAVDTTTPSVSTTTKISTTCQFANQCERTHFTPEQRAAFAVQFAERRHGVASVGAALVGVGILATRKGTKAHRVMGRVWTGVAVLTSLNAFRMRDHQGNLTWFHGLSAITLSSAIAGVYCARTKKIAHHKKLMGIAYASAALAGVVAWATPGKTIACKGRPTVAPPQATH